MQELEKRLKLLETEFLSAYEKVGVKEKLIQLAKLEKETAEPEIWRDVKRATEMNQEVARLSSETEPWELLKTQISDLKELIAI